MPKEKIDVKRKSHRIPFNKRISHEEQYKTIAEAIDKIDDALHPS